MAYQGLGYHWELGVCIRGYFKSNMLKVDNTERSLGLESDLGS